MVLLENNLAVEVIEKIKTDLKEELTSGKIVRKSVEHIIKDRLRESIGEVLDIPPLDLDKEVARHKPANTHCSSG
ncbi:MAG: hypothetical protein HC945_02295 [Nitrosarchaeum sp.]|nr:hypothetical protein [Nitrosarchaeum sp.]